MARIHTNEYIKCDEYMILRINSKSLGTFDVKIDLSDYEEVKKYTWSVSEYWNKKTTSPNKKKHYIRNKDVGLLHRFLTNCPKGKVVDHADGDELNCRRYNIRVCTYSQNNLNKRPYSNNKTGHPGVCWFPYRGYNKWKAHIQVDGKLINLGYFDTKEEAIEVRNKAEKKYFGDFRKVI